ncbi:MAG: hypothetical protein JHC31_12625 [Sulfurihydrogenibium sp.]|jgi:hypothetical protein|nr:hypothetical protein [Sulfurihydrogenibium sp.]
MKVKIPLTLSKEEFSIKDNETLSNALKDYKQKIKFLKIEEYEITMEYDFTRNRTDNVYEVEIILDFDKEIVNLNINGDESVLPMGTFVAYLDEEFFFSMRKEKNNCH